MGKRKKQHKNARKEKLKENQAGQTEEDEMKLKLLQTFPEEIWIQILKHLKSRKDVISCFYTCHFFRDRLQEQMRTCALHCLVNNLNKKDRDLRLTTSDLLTCRLLSKSWKQSVDSFLEKRPNVDCAKGPRLAVNLGSAAKFDKAKLDSFLEIIGSKPKSNPFPGRVLKIEVSLLKNKQADAIVQEQDLRQCLNTLWYFLGVYGTHFWHLGFITFENEIHLVPIYQFLYKCLYYLPNVKTLSLDMIPEEARPGEWGVQAQLKRFVEHEPFPKLRKLEKLVLSGVVDSPFYNSVLESNSQIVQLRLDSASSGFFGEKWVESAKLKEIYVDCFDWSMLYRLDLDPDGWWDPKIAFVTTVFRSLEHLSDSLKKVTLKLPSVRLRKSWRLLLPNLEKLHFNATSFLDRIKLDFLQPSRHSLKELHVEMSQKELDIDQEFEFQGSRTKIDAFERFKIWNSFGHLKRFTFQAVIRQEEERLVTQTWCYSRSRFGKKIVLTRVERVVKKRVALNSSRAQQLALENLS